MENLTISEGEAVQSTYLDISEMWHVARGELTQAIITKERICSQIKFVVEWSHAAITSTGEVLTSRRRNYCRTFELAKLYVEKKLGEKIQ